jgi:hypothetical protein
MYVTEQQQQNVQVRLCFLPVSAGADPFRKWLKVQLEATRPVFLSNLAWRMFARAMSKFWVRLRDLAEEAASALPFTT